LFFQRADLLRQFGQAFEHGCRTVVLHAREGGVSEADFVVVKLWKNNKEELDSPDYEEVMRVDGRSFWGKETYILYALKGEMQK